MAIAARSEFMAHRDVVEIQSYLFLGISVLLDAN
jgi:hypothetical protein